MESKYGGFRKNKLEKPPLAAKKQMDLAVKRQEEADFMLAQQVEALEKKAK